MKLNFNHRFNRRPLFIAALTLLASGLPLSAAAFSLSPMPHIEVAPVDRGYISPVSSVLVVDYFNPPPPGNNYPALRGSNSGVNLQMEIGATVVAPKNGIITFAGKVFGVPTISLSHPDGLTSTFQPVSANVLVGDSISIGAPIGTLAGSHCPQITCVHWSVRRATGLYVDPLWLLGLAAPIILYPAN